LHHQAQGSIAGVSLTKQNPSIIFDMGNYTLTAGLRTHYRPRELPERAYGIILNTGPDEFIVAGADLKITFKPKTPGPAVAGLATVEEGIFKNGQWIPGRILNGDEIMLSYEMAENAAKHETGTGLKFYEPGIQKVTLYRFE